MKLNKNIEKVYKYLFKKNTKFDNFFVRIFIYVSFQIVYSSLKDYTGNKILSFMIVSLPFSLFSIILLLNRILYQKKLPSKREGIILFGIIFMPLIYIVLLHFKRNKF